MDIKNQILSQIENRVNQKLGVFGKSISLGKADNFDKEILILEEALNDAFFKIVELQKSVYFGSTYDSLLLATGRGTGKTRYVILLALWHIVHKKTDVLCFKEFENSTTELQQSFSDIISLLGIDRLFKVHRTEIGCVLNTNRIIFKGIRSVKSSFESIVSVRNKLKVFTNIGLLILDEANSITYNILETLISTMRNNHKEQVKIIALFNPYQAEAPIESYFKGRSNCLVSKNEFSIADLPEKYRDVSLWKEYCEDKVAVAEGRKSEKQFLQNWHGIPNDVENGLYYSGLEELKDISSLAQYPTIFAIDPAFGGGDTCAMSIVSMIDSNTFIFTGFSWQESIEVAIVDMEYILKTLGLTEGFMEGNNISQEWLSNHLRDFNVEVKKPNLNKNYRIETTLYTYMSYYRLEIPYKIGNVERNLTSNLYFSNLFNYVLNSNIKDNEADSLAYGIYYHKGLKI